MLVLAGAAALTPARLEQRLEALRRLRPGLRRVHAAHLYLLELQRELTPEERANAEALLRYGGLPAEHHAEGWSLLVTPRLGTVSPWSSKATEIFHNCGLEVVVRVERAVRWSFVGEVEDGADLRAALHDRMTQSVLHAEAEAEALFQSAAPRPLRVIALGADAPAALRRADEALGLVLAPDEIDYLAEAYGQLGRDPTDVELMMFAQANSEHCRHKIFNAAFSIDGEPQQQSLFSMIRQSTQASPGGVLSAYSDNAAVMEGHEASRFFVEPEGRRYHYVRESAPILMKVETHNHPTAIAPFAGAATGSGGEIRDESATGRGSKAKVGLTGFSVSNLELPSLPQPWETPYGKPDRIASALDIMLEAPIGGAAYNNEFGRPNLCGYFRSFELDAPGPAGVERRGYHKPIMIAGGYGHVRPMHVKKGKIPVGAPLVVLGGPAMLIGLGGGAASSVAAGSSSAELDFASVQRDNAEIQRRCQEVIDACSALGGDTPIVSIHDVGAGGLSNALPELVHESRRGARLQLRDIPSAEPGMSPLELWCNESQERYVLALEPSRLAAFEAICRRERAPFAVLGTATDDGTLLVEDRLLGTTPIALPLELLLGKPPRMQRDAARGSFTPEPFSIEGLELGEALTRVLQLPAVADKSFLITIGDRSVSGLIARDQLVGPWQVPVADCGVTCTGFEGYTGEAMAMGERAPVALLSAGASARLAVAEALLNLAAAPVAQLGDVKLSANWMAAAGHPGEDARLYEAVRAVGVELCPALGVAIPVGKDSLSMRTAWTEAGQARSVTAPLSLVVSAFAKVTDVRQTLTPELRRGLGDTRLWLIDLSGGQQRLGGSALAQVYGKVGATAPDLDAPERLRALYAALPELRAQGLLHAYHDVSDGGLVVTLLEMAFASGVGLDVELGELGGDVFGALFAEELGVVVQVRQRDEGALRELLARHGLAQLAHPVATPRDDERVVLRRQGATLFEASRFELRALWSSTTHAIARLRDHVPSVEQEHAARLSREEPGLSAVVGFELEEDVAAPFIGRGARPRVAVLREQGVNGQVEMAAALDRAGFEAVDVHMTDVHSGRVELAGFQGLAICGGFSYGDVLGAGEGWAKSILFREGTRRQFQRFFERPDTFTLGVCNGCQMLSALRELVPGAEDWPSFVRNRSEQFEARLVLVEIAESPSVLLRGMEGSRLPVVVAHGEGRARFAADEQRVRLERAALVAGRYVDHFGSPTERYPFNPNGSPGGLCALTTPDGRVTIMMPHPERVFRTVQHSWHPRAWGEDGPWLRLFRNARVFVG